MAKLFLDLETSGLDPETDHILEVGVVLTDDDFGVLWEQSFLVLPEGGLYECIEGSSSVVQKMHEGNGLWADLDAASPEDTCLQEELPCVLSGCFDRCEDVLGRPLKTTPIAGFNPFFDRKWLERHAPEQIRRLHYRSFDVSTLRAVVQDHFGQDLPARGGVTHRALDDCHAAVHYCQRFKAQCLVWPGEHWA